MGETVKIKGVGGKASTIEVVWIPIAIGNYVGFIKTVVLDADIPWLISKHVIKGLGGILDFDTAQ